jgi:MerR family transcriptional regulator, mercuric resistance operon regulatory protein
MRISDLAKTCDVGVETVRYYQRVGLLDTPDKPSGRFRVYGKEDVTRLRFVRRAQQLGFSLEEIANLLRLSAANCDDVQTLAVHKLDLIRGKIEDLARMARVLEQVVRQCRARQSHEGCPIIAALTEPKRASARPTGGPAAR